MGETPDWVRRYYSRLCHHGIKGQKWGVRNGPPYPLNDRKETVEKTDKGGIVKTTVHGHGGNKPKGIPNSISDHINREGKVDKRAFYDKDGWKAIEIHTTDHKNPKWHKYGNHGEHIHYYEWNHETGYPLDEVTAEIPDNMRKENDDIL